MAKFQLCKYRSKKDDQWKIGLARVKEFGLPDCDLVLDENGTKVKRIWDYELCPYKSDTTVDVSPTRLRYMFKGEYVDG